MSLLPPLTHRRLFPFFVRCRLASPSSVSPTLPLSPCPSPLLTTGCSRSISASSAARRLSACTCHRTHLRRLLRLSRGRARCWPLVGSPRLAERRGISSICDPNDHRRRHHRRRAAITAKRSTEMARSLRSNRERSAIRPRLKRRRLRLLALVQSAASSLPCSPRLLPLTV